MLIQKPLVFRFFFFNDTATTEIYTLSLHDALPISTRGRDGPRENRRRNGGSVQSLDLDDSVPADPRRNDRNRFEAALLEIRYRGGTCRGGRRRLGATHQAGRVLPSEGRPDREGEPDPPRPPRRLGAADL